MKTILSLSLILLSLVASGCNFIKKVKSNTENGDTAYLWQGFEHTWDEKVHRVGRIGNWIQNSNSDFPRRPSIHHSAQAGSAKDGAEFRTKYSVVQAANTKFHHGMEQINIQTPDSTARRFFRRVEIDRSEIPGLANHDNVEVVLNGFDLKKRAGEIKKLGVLEINIGQVRVTPATIQFDISGELLMGCNSAECPILSKVDYFLGVRYLVIASNDDDFQAIDHPDLHQFYDYDSGLSTHNSTNDTGSDYFLGTRMNPRFNVQVKALAMKAFRFEVSKTVSVGALDYIPHLYKWKMWLDYAEDFDFEAPRAFSLMRFEHNQAGDSNYPHLGKVDIRITPVSLLFKGGSDLKCTWDRNHDFGNYNAGDTEYTETRELSGLLDAECFPVPVN